MVYDIIIIGSGPAGLTSAIYAGRANKKVLVIEREACGGMITHSPKVENYPGYNVISGLDLADKFVAQAMDMGVEFEFDEVLSVTKQIDTFLLKGNYKEYEGRSVIIATGSKHRKLNVENEDKLVGKGISYCAVCDGAFSANKDVAVIGGGNSALQEAILLSGLCTHVTIIQNLPFLTGEQALIEQINKTENISIKYNKTVFALMGDASLEALILKDAETEAIETFPITSVFVAIGQVADNEAFRNVCTLDDQGFIVSSDMCETNVEGIYVAGDCRQKRIRQIVTATGDGSIAAIQAIRYLDSH